MKNLVITIVLVILVFYLSKKLYPFHQRYWASITYGKKDAQAGRQFVADLETIAYGLTFNQANELATELRKKPDVKITEQDGVIHGERKGVGKCVTICPFGGMDDSISIIN